MSRRPFKLLIDFGLWILSIPLAYFLRLDVQARVYLSSILSVMAVSVPIQVLLMALFRPDRHSWHRVSTREIPALALVVVIWILGLYGFSVFLPLEVLLPRSVPLIAGALALLSFGGIRIGYRVYFEKSHEKRTPSSGTEKVLIIGAGEAGVILAKEMLRHPESGLKPVGFLDDDRNKQGQRIVGFPVLGPLNQIREQVLKLKVDEVLIAIPSARGSVIRKIAAVCREIGVRNRTIPGISDLLNGAVSVSQLREVEVEDLLRREPANLELEIIAEYLRGKCILVTGAGGSIGSEVVRQVTRFSPGRLIILGRGENSIYEIERELKGTNPKFPISTVICDVRDRAKLEEVFKDLKPEVVFHAAAHKHVPLMEMNPDEAILNNVGGTKSLVDLSLKYGVSRFVNISTDKAVNPTSIMGASKRISELVVLWGAKRASIDAQFVSVRFGNVLGSRGSVVPLFKDQIKKREPITITHKDMVRYFMTIPEATQLVLQAGAQAASTSERGSIFILDMGEPVKIYDLAKDLIELSGLTLGEDIEIIFTGLRPGEKLYEELLTAEENAASTKNSKIFTSKHLDPLNIESFESEIQSLFEVAKTRNSEKIRKKVLEFVPTYREPNLNS